MSRKPDLVIARPDLGIEYHFPGEQREALLKLGEVSDGPD